MLSPSSSTNQFVLLTIVFEGGLAAVALFVGWLTGFSPWQGLASPGYDAVAFGRDVLWGVSATAPAAFCLLLETQWGWLAIREAKEQAIEILGRFLAKASPWQLLLIAGLAGFGEELLFRGLIQAGLATLLMPYLPVVAATTLAIAVGSLAFGLCHYLSFWYFVLATLAGVYFGLLTVLTGSLLPAMIAHALYDFVAFAYLVAEMRESDSRARTELVPTADH